MSDKLIESLRTKKVELPPLLQKLVDSIEVVGGEACWDHAVMYDLRDYINNLAADDAARWTMRELTGDEARAIAQSVRFSASDSPSPAEYVRAGWQAATRAAAQPEPIYAKSVVRRLATQMGWKPPSAAAPQSAEPATDAQWVEEGMRIAGNATTAARYDQSAATEKAELAALRAHLSTRPQQAAPTEADRLDAEWEHGFEVYEVSGDDWLQVASGAGPDEESAMREAAHYAAQYAQDGPVAVFHTMKRRIDAAMSAQAGGKEQVR